MALFNIRIAVAVNHLGQWSAYGTWGTPDDEALAEAGGHISQDGPTEYYFVDAEFPNKDAMPALSLQSNKDEVSATIAVSMNQFGEWNAHGNWETSLQDSLVEVSEKKTENLDFCFVEVDVPIPKVKSIKGSSSPAVGPQLAPLTLVKE